MSAATTPVPGSPSVPRTICHVIDYGGKTGGSFIPALEALCLAVIDRGERFAVCATEIEGATWPAELERAGADVFLVRSDAAVVETLRRLRPSIVHAHFTRYDLPVLRAAEGTRIFWHVHSHRENFSAAARAKAVLKYRMLGARVEKFVAVSAMLARECVAFSAPAAKVAVVLNGIDTKRFRPPSDDERRLARESFGIGAGDRVVLFFERVAYKGGATVREALAATTGLRLLVAGGTLEDRERFGGPPDVIPVERAADARQLYWAADVLAFASRNEAFGYVLAEALSTGLPVAATDIAVVHEICDSVDQVGLFPVDDAGALGVLLPQCIGRRSASGRKHMIAHFDLARWTADMLRLYDEPGASR